MKSEYDFSTAVRGPVVRAGAGKTRTTIRLDNKVLAWFRAAAHREGGGSYQKLINDALVRHVESARIKSVNEPIEKTLRRVIREELRKAS